MDFFQFKTRRSFIKSTIQYTAVMAFGWPQVGLGRLTKNKIAVNEVLKGQRSVANAAWWGYHAASGTSALQGAIQSGAKKIVVPYMGTPWIIDPIYLESDQEIEFEKGVILLAKKGAFKGKEDCLLKAVNKENILLYGQNVLLKMWRDDYKTKEYKPSQWRHCLSLLGCRDISVNGLSFGESGGDGIYIGRGIGEKSRHYCENISIRNVTCDRNYRQGIGVISAKNLLIEKCFLSNTEGTNPQAGIDFEPNNPDELLNDCVLRETVITSNKRFGLLFALGNLDSHSTKVSVTVQRCEIRLNGENALRIFHSDILNTPTGYIRFVENQIEGRQVIDQIPGLYLYL